MKDRPVFHIVPSPFFANRGCHMRILGEIRALQKKGYRIIMATYHNGSDVDNLDIRRILNVPWYNKLEAGPSWQKIFLDFLLFFKCLWIYVKERPVLIHGHLHEGAFIGGLLKILSFNRIGLVFDVQGSLTSELDTFDFFHGWKKFMRKLSVGLENLICRMPDYFVCSSASNADIIRKLGFPKDRIHTVIDGVHSDFFNEKPPEDFRKSLGIPNDVPVVTFTGALLKAKGVDQFLDAMPHVISECPQTFFLIVGYPVEESQKAVKSMGVDKQVVFTGMVDYYKLPQYLGVSDVSVDPKVDEAGEASGKIINYMGAGLPVVCYESVNNRRFLGDNGVYATNADPKDLASKICRVIKDPEMGKCLGEANRQRVRDVFSWDASIADVDNIYQALIDKR
ncbi:MAG: glycosyltransferase family 4 protein [Candidatus Theseobacter exili]|nr:glycosyltransferase family 4 protein [Candidatus Theseobacter exili]